MAEYIERDFFLKIISHKPSSPTTDREDRLINGFISAVKNCPAADVRPVVRGKWKRVVDFTGVEAFGYKETMIVGYGCNVCGYEVDVSEGDYNFCPNCGADMREES